jgi:radical SAM-linked protein
MVSTAKTTIAITFRKCGEARFLSHLDLMRAISRALRRSGLPIYFTEGFNPKPKISYISMPLSMGHTSECENMAFYLTQPTEAGEIRCVLDVSLPPGIALESVEIIDQGKKPAPAGYEYHVYFMKKTSESDSVPRIRDRALAEKHSFRLLSAEEALEARLMKDEEKNREFIGDFAAAAFVINTGEDYRRPDEILNEISETDGFFIHFHRRRTIQ